MNRPIVLLSAVAAMLFSSCAVSPLAPAEKQAAIKQLTGDWYYTASDPMLGLMGTFIPEFNARRLTIQPDGTMILSVDDSAIGNKLVVMKTSDAGIEMRLARDFGGSRDMFYHRATNTVTIPIKVTSRDRLTGGKKVNYSPFSFGRAAAPQ